MCARPFPLPVWLPTSAPHGPGDGDGNTLPGVVGAMRVIPSSGCPMSTPSVGGCASQLVWFGQRGIHWACQAHQILSERQNIATRRLAACLCLVPDVCGLCQRPAPSHSRLCQIPHVSTYRRKACQSAASSSGLVREASTGHAKFVRSRQRSEHRNQATCSLLRLVPGP